MKLREFVANSLPRVRGRKKKNQSQKSSAVKERNDGNQSKCQAPHEQCISRIYHGDITRKNVNEPLSEIFSSNQFTVSEYGGSTAAPPQYDSCCEYQTSYLNTSLDETKYVSSKDVGGFLTDQEKHSLLIYSSDCERHHNATSKSRSRIRTNPWLPSPSSTPYNASRAFPHAPIHGILPTPPDEDLSTEGCCSDKDVFMETDVSPTTPESTDSGFKSSISSDINYKQNVTFAEPVPIIPIQRTPKRDKTEKPKHTNSKVLKASESFDVSRNSGRIEEAKFCVRSQTTLDIDCVVYCSENGNLDKQKWRNQHDLSLVSPPIDCFSNFDWKRDNSLTRDFETKEHNISFEYEENLNCRLEEPLANLADNASIEDLLEVEVTKEVAVQTDFEENEDSDWMTASSFEDNIDLTNQSPRKLSLISDCMQESTDTGYSSLTREGLLELDEDYQFFSNKENISHNLNGWLENRENVTTHENMGQSWCEASIGRNFEKFTDPLNHSQSLTGGPCRDIFEVPFNMTSSMYIPAAEVIQLKEPLQYLQPKSETAESKASEKNSHTTLTTPSRLNSYLPVLEYGPVIRKPSENKEKSHSENKIIKPKQHNPQDTGLRSPGSKTHKKMFLSSPLSQIENTSPLATSTPAEDRKIDSFKQKSRALIMDNVKSQISALAGRPKMKKNEIRKPSDNLDVIRDYLGYASFEDFYFAKKCPPLSTGRTLNQIKTSLEEKVDQLKQEKFLVEQKIIEANEEERIKKHEKLKYQKQLNYHRKQLLLQTLHDLKDKLENQSDRLQKSYSTILNLQSRFVHRHPSITLMRAGPV